ncbi:hypothetical protein Adt_35565 [Abeliophyllum distichum]|uniref:Uncharacterized protein n=1 Tax=Abeliophyllum distichum TaxID=126358 RepID=A0ABD1QF29_9LAMI
MKDDNMMVLLPPLDHLMGPFHFYVVILLSSVVLPTCPYRYLCPITPSSPSVPSPQVVQSAHQDKVKEITNDKPRERTRGPLSSSDCRFMRDVVRDRQNEKARQTIVESSR